MVLKKDDFQSKLESSSKKTNLGVAVLFLGTVALSALLWIQGEFKNWRQKVFKPITYHIDKTSKEEDLQDFIGFKPDIKDLSGLQKSIDLLLEKAEGVYGIYFYHLEDEQEMGINEDKVFVAASVNKIPIIVNFYQAVEEGRLEEKKEYRDKMLDELSKIKGEIGSATYKSRILYIEQEYALWVVQKVIDILDQNKLLLIEQRPILEGGYE